MVGLPPEERGWARGLAGGQGLMAGLFGNSTWPGRVNRHWGNRYRSRLTAQPGQELCSQPVIPTSLRAVIEAGDSRKVRAGVECDSHPPRSAATDIDCCRVQGRPEATGTLVAQDLICTRGCPGGRFTVGRFPLTRVANGGRNSRTDRIVGHIG